jgi:hypothetical protein
MDMQTPDHASTPFPTSSAGPPSRMFSRRLLKILAATTPGEDDDPTALAEMRETTQELFGSLDPRDPADAMLAAIAVAAAQSAMDNFARAARPGMSDETVMRLRSKALAAGRAYATVHRYFRKPQTVAAPSATPVGTKAPQVSAPKPPPAEPVVQPVEVPPGFVALRQGAEPIPAVFRPRDRFGKEIPSWRRDLMTSAQALAAFSYPPDPTAKAAAIAEEEAKMAEQKASEARGTQSASLNGQQLRQGPEPDICSEEC